MRRKAAVHYVTSGLRRSSLCNARSGGEYKNWMRNTQERKRVTCLRCLKILNKEPKP